MNKSCIAIFTATLLLAACSGNQNKEHDHHDGAHSHEDGSVHQNHKMEDPKQEEFSVSTDSLSLPTQTETGHTHEGQEHSHKH